MLSWPLRNICVTSEHVYVPPFACTSWSFPHSSHITGFVTRALRRVPLVEQELLALPGHMAQPGFSGARVSRSVVFCVVFGRSLFVLFSFGHCVVCSEIYVFWLPLWYLQTLLTIDSRPASSISAIYRTITSSILYKHYIEMREEIAHEVNVLWLPQKKYGKLCRNKKVIILLR
jgi:hypothetical protein